MKFWGTSENDLQASTLLVVTACPMDKSKKLVFFAPVNASNVEFKSRSLSVQSVILSLTFVLHKARSQLSVASNQDISLVLVLVLLWFEIGCVSLIGK